MTNKPNKGRTANAAERAHARKWVELYRLAEQAPDGRYCVNPDAPYSEQDFIYADDPELLLLLLQCFAETGKFLPKDTLNIKGMVLRSEILQLRKKTGKVPGGAVQAVADKYNLEKRTVGRLVRVNDKN